MKIWLCISTLLAALLISTLGFAATYIVPYEPYQYAPNQYYPYHGDSQYDHTYPYYHDYPNPYYYDNVNTVEAFDAFGKPLPIEQRDAFGKPLGPVPLDAFGKPLEVVNPHTNQEITPPTNTPSITYQNDTDKAMTGGYTAVINNKNNQTKTIEDTFAIETGTTTTPKLPYYLVNERIYITDMFGECPSTVIFNVQQRGGVFQILEGSSKGQTCMTPSGGKALVGTVLQDGFTILLLEEPA